MLNELNVDKLTFIVASNKRSAGCADKSMYRVKIKTILSSLLSL